MPTCNICKYAGRPTYKSPCSECKEFSKYEYENKKTNADIIRSMIDEELADIIACPKGLFDRMECFDYSRNCEDCILEWLQQPAE